MSRVNNYLRLRWLLSRFPVEVSLGIFLLSTFVIRFINNPGFWFPASFTPVEQIPSDILTCTPERGSPNDIYCDVQPPRLLRDFPVRTEYNETLVESYPALYGIGEGGSYRPPKCTPQIVVNIIIPYRRRQEQLSLFLQHMHPFLTGQEISYRIFVIEQTDTAPFNRGKLFNVGFMESMKINPTACCFIFHDVDLLPQNQYNTYACSKSGPRHMSSSVNTFRYHLLYRNLFGGVTAVKKRDMKASNGFSNLFYGWGGEDDDWSSRLRVNGLQIIRWDQTVSRYYMLTHRKEAAGARKDKLLSESEVRWESDGLSSLHYKVVDITNLPLYTRIRVNL